MSYKAPKMPSVVHLSGAQKARDAQLRALQERAAELTRPVDMFLHQIWSLERNNNLDPQEVLELSQTFAKLIRSQLGGMAGRINTMRVDNVRASQGADYRPDELDLVDPHTLQEDIKTFKTLKNAFQPKDQHKGYDYRRDKGNNTNNSNNNNSHNNGNNNGHGNYYRNNNQDRRSRSRSRRDNNNDHQSSFHRNSDNRRGNSQQRGRNTSRRNNRSPESEDDFNDS